jgi:hypothetical protein
MFNCSVICVILIWNIFTQYKNLFPHTASEEDSARLTKVQPRLTLLFPTNSFKTASVSGLNQKDPNFNPYQRGIRKLYFSEIQALGRKVQMKLFPRSRPTGNRGIV